MSNEISKTVVDYEQALREMHRLLSEKGTWVDTLPTALGESILSMIAGSVAGHQHLAMMGYRNAFYQTANRDSSIYALSRGQGILLERRVSAALTARLKNNYDQAIFLAPFSTFFVGAVKFYNPTQIVFAPGVEQDVYLVQGEVKVKQFDLDTVDPVLAEFKLDEPDFVVTRNLWVSTSDKVSGNTRSWQPTDRGLFEYGAQDYVFFESTTAEGDVSLTFGDGRYGAKLPRNNLLNVRYIVSIGEAGNNIMHGERVRSAQHTMIDGFSITSAVGGSESKSAAYYKQYGPIMFRARKKWISKNDIRAGISGYPGVADVVLQAQRDIAPNDPTWKNTIRVTILPSGSDSWGGANPNPKSASWQNFVEWLYPHLHSLIEIQTWNPTKVFVDVQVTVTVYSWADLEKVRTDAMANILAVFQKRLGSLGRKLAKSDIKDACKVEGVDYVEVHSPMEETLVLSDPTSYFVLNGLPHVNVVYTERESNSGTY